MVSKITALTFLNTVIEPALQAIHLWSMAAGELLLGTALQESGLIHRRQIGDGPALGLFQMETATYNDCYDNYLRYPTRAMLLTRILAVAHRTEWPEPEWLLTHDQFAAAMARVKYLRVPEEFPAAGDIEAQAAYYVRYYNAGGAATISQYMANWHAAMGE